MNKERRKQINEAADLLAKAFAMIDDGKSILQGALDEEQEYFDNMPEGLQDGEKGQTAQDAINVLALAIEAMEGLDDVQDDVQGYIDEATV
jgi:hypothetical protein